MKNIKVEGKLSPETMETLKGFGYRDFRQLEDGRWVCLAPYIYTWAILRDLDRLGHVDRWCYSSFNFAKAAFDAWDGLGEPSHEGLTRKV